MKSLSITITHPSILADYTTLPSLKNVEVTELPSDSDIRVALSSKTIAVVGLSRDESKDSHSVPAYLQAKGYRVVPINPSAKEILGEKSYPSLAALPDDLQERVEVVLVFRPTADVPAVLRDCLSMSPCHVGKRVFWTQLGITMPASEEKRARRAGLLVVQDKCMRVEHANSA